MQNNEYRFSFEKLNVWIDSKNLLIKIYKLTDNFPKDEKYVFVPQIRRSSLSVPSNIAEGSSRVSKKDQAHFYQIAYSSLMELTNQLLISQELKFITVENMVELRMDIVRVSNQINALRNSRLEERV